VCVASVDDLLERGGLRSEWLRHTELTGGVRGRDARLDDLVDADRLQHQLHELPALLHHSRQQHPCQQYQHLLQLGHDHRELWFRWLELCLQVSPAAALASTLAPSAVSLASAALASTALVATALRTTRVVDLLERGGLRSEWLRHAELTGGVRGRDARLDDLVDVVGRPHQLHELPALLHPRQQQYPCQRYQHILQLGRDHSGLWRQYLELRLQVPPPSSLASTLAPSAVSLASAASAALAASSLASTALVATALRTTRVDDLLERGGLRSEWLRHAELTSGVRGRDERLDDLVDADRLQHQLHELLALLHHSRQQYPCQQ